MQSSPRINWRMEKMSEQTENLNYDLDVNAEIILSALKVDLSVKDDNYFIGSGLGGDIELLYALMSRDIKVSVHNYRNVVVDLTGFADQIIEIKFPNHWFARIDDLYSFQTGSKENPIVKSEALKELRLAFPSLKRTRLASEVTINNLLDVNWLREQKQTPDVINLTSCIRIFQCARPLLVEKNILVNNVNNLLDIERKNIEAKFLSDLNLPEDALSNDSPNESYRKMLDKHPVWGKKMQQISDREWKISQLLIDGETRDLLETMESFPDFIKVLCVRNLIGLKMMVALNLDNLFSTIII